MFCTVRSSRLFVIGPDVLATLKDSHNVGRRLHPKSLDVVEASQLRAGNISPFLVLTRAELYAVFEQQWCDREVTRQLNEEEDWKTTFDTDRSLWQAEHATRVKNVLVLCKDLAFLLFMQGKTQIYIHTSITTTGPELNGAPRPNTPDISMLLQDQEAVTSLQINDFAARVHKMFVGQQQEWRCSPLKKSGSFFSFLHKTVQEYFVAWAVCQELAALNTGDTLHQMLLQGQFILPASRKSTFLLLAQKLLHSDRTLNTVRFCADLVEKRLEVQNYVSLGPILNRATGRFAAGRYLDVNPHIWVVRVQPLARALWDVVQASRLDVARANPATPVAAANSITILNAAGLVFDHCQLSHATLGPTQIGAAPAMESSTTFYADLSGAVLSYADLSHACLGRANLSTTCLDHADLRSANLWDVEFGQRTMLVQNESGHLITSIALRADGKYMVSGSDDKNVKIWSMETWDVVRVLKGHKGLVTSVAYTADGRYVVSGSRDCDVKVWQTETGHVVTLSEHRDHVNCVTSSPDGRYIASGSEDSSMILWRSETWSLMMQLTGHSFPVTSVAFNFDGRYVASGSRDMSVILWSTETGDVLHTLPHSYCVYSVAFNYDGRYLVSGSGEYMREENSVIMWSTETGNVARTFTGHHTCVFSVVFSADGRFVVSGSQDGTILMWLTETGSLFKTFRQSQVNSIAFSADGQYIVSLDQYNGVRLWLAHVGDVVRSLKGTSEVADVSAVTLSSDGRYVASRTNRSAGYYSTVTLWSTDTGDVVRTLTGLDDVLYDIYFTADGRYVMWAGKKKKLQLWSIETGLLQDGSKLNPLVTQVGDQQMGLIVYWQANNVILQRGSVILRYFGNYAVFSCMKTRVEGALLSVNNRKLLKQLRDKNFYSEGRVNLSDLDDGCCCCAIS